jgi:hypothetical protein
MVLWEFAVFVKVRYFLLFNLFKKNTFRQHVYCTPFFYLQFNRSGRQSRGSPVSEYDPMATAPTDISVARWRRTPLKSSGKLIGKLSWNSQLFVCRF